MHIGYYYMSLLYSHCYKFSIPWVVLTMYGLTERIVNEWMWRDSALKNSLISNGTEKVSGIPTALVACLAPSAMFNTYEVMPHSGGVSQSTREFDPSLVHVGFLVTQGLFLFPSKVFHFYNLPVLLTGRFNMWSHHVTASFSKNISNMYLKYRKVNVTYKTKWIRAQGTCLQFTVLYLFPIVTFSLYSWYTHSSELTFPCTKITQVTVTCYSFYAHCERNRTQSKLMDCYLHS